MMHFLHLRDLLSDEQIEQIKSPFYLHPLETHTYSIFPHSDESGFYKRGECFAIVSYFIGDCWDYYRGDYLCEERTIPILAPFAGAYTRSMVYTWRSPNHKDPASFNDVMFNPKIFDINPIVYFTADNEIDWLIGDFAYRKVSLEDQIDSLLISDEDINLYLRDPEWIKQATEEAIKYLQSPFG